MKELISQFKDSIKESGLILDLTPKDIFICVGVALICSLIIYVVYRFFYRGSCYSENFNVLLILTTLVTSFIIMTISANIVLSLGMVGSLSIIRFRSAVKDPLDVGFLFWSVAVGITCGAGLYQIALLCSLFIAGVYILSGLLNFGNKKYLLVISYSKEAEESIEKLLKGKFKKLKNRISSKDGCEVTYQIRFSKSVVKLSDEISKISGVKSSMLVEFTGEN